ncbi:MAG: NADH-quinone oxidoreductase subunit F, partial [Acidobacteria bacterium]
DTDIVRTTYSFIKFFAHESCGWCVPCREGTRWIVKIIERLLRGGGTERDLDMLVTLSDNMFGRTHCPLGDAAAWAVGPAVKKFRADFERYLTRRGAVAAD